MSDLTAEAEIASGLFWAFMASRLVPAFNATPKSYWHRPTRSR